MDIWGRLYPYLAALITGVLIFLSIPKIELSFLAWISLSPLIYIAVKKPPLTSVWAGGLAGVVFHSVCLYWIASVMHKYGKLSLVVSWLIALVLVLYLSLYFALFTFLLSKLTCTLGPKLLFIAPFLWVSLEYIKTFLLTGFPWELIGYSQYRNLPLIQIASFTGVYGVSFLIILANCLIIWWLTAGLKGKFSLGITALCGMIFAAALLYGYWRLSQPFPTGEGIKVACIQGNVSQEKKMTTLYLEEIFRDHFLMTREASLRGNQLIVWSESAVPLSFTSSRSYQEAVRNLVASHKIHLLLGSDDITPASASSPEKYFNSAFLLTPQGEVAGKYDKIHLVPFGEYVPLRKLFFFAGKLVQESSDFSPGESYTLLNYDSHPIAVAICYEIIFPQLIRAFISRGAELITTITNDAWWGRSSAPYQHFSMVVFRAVENRRYVVRAANTGISGIIDPYGRILVSSPIFVKTIVEGVVYPMEVGTFYLRYGDLLCWLSLLLTAMALLTLIRARKMRFT